MQERIGVAVAGCGVVGSGLAEMLTMNHDEISRAAGCDVFLKYVVDIRDVAVPEGVERTSDFDKVLADPEIKIVAETIGGAKIAYEYTKRALQSGISVITSNKELVATKGEELKKLAAEKNVWYLYEAAVCGGVPVLRPIKTCLAGNRITSLSGIVNGSTNYLLTRMEQAHMSFPTALGEAKELGYVEANPAADVDGWDARRKLAILANAAFGSSLSDDGEIPTEGISHVTERDLNCAKALGGAVKLIAHGEMADDGWIGWVHPALVMEGHPLYSVKDVFNGLVVTGDCVGDVMFYGRGAGKLPTASALAGDVVEMCRSIDKPLIVEKQQQPKIMDYLKKSMRIALRVEEGLLPLCEALPVERVESVGNMSAVITCAAPLGELMKSLEKAHSMGVQTGIPLFVL